MDINVFAADTDADARQLATTDILRRYFQRAAWLSGPTIDDTEAYWPPHEKAQAPRMLKRSVVASADTVRTGLQSIICETGVDDRARRL